MYFVLSLFILVILGYYFIYFYGKKKIPKGLRDLPRIKGFPFIGLLFTINEPLWSYLLKAVEKYGSIFKIKLGGRDIIIINTYESLIKCLKDQNNIFSGRWQNIVFKVCCHDSGIIFKDKEWWSIQRSFALKVLKDFGLGKQRSTEIVNQECSILMKEIEESHGKSVKLNDFFSKSTVNVISALVMNMGFKREDESFAVLTDAIEKIVHKNAFFEHWVSMYPFFEKQLLLSAFLLKVTGIDGLYKNVHNFIKEIIVEHKTRFSPENEGVDLIDIYLKEQYILNQNNIPDHSFTDWQLIRVVTELFVAGFDTTSNTLVWSMLLLAKHSDIQEKVHKEIIDYIGTERIPNLADKKFLPYTQAVMDEIFRFSSVVPLALPHRVLENTEINGFFIPKNSLVFPNTYACHRDSKIWEKPFQFFPEHFLKLENGEMKYTPRDELVPFGIGKRQCLGEGLARLEFFVFLTSILQRFKVRFESDISDERFSKIIRGTEGIIRVPEKSSVVFEMI